MKWDDEEEYYCIWNDKDENWYTYLVALMRLVRWLEDLLQQNEQ